MQVEYRREMNHSYLVLKNETHMETDSYTVKMLLHNSIKGLLPCSHRIIDGESYFYYDVTSRQSLFSLYENRKFRCGDLTSLFCAAADTMDSPEGYLLSSEMLLLNPRYIYWESEGSNFAFCCCPCAEPGEELCTLTEYILPKIDHQDAGAVVLGYGIYRESMEENSGAEQIRRELAKCTRPQETVREQDKKQEETVQGLDEEARQKALDAFFEEEEEVEEKRPLWGLAGCVLTLGALAVCGWLLLHYRLATAGQVMVGALILAVLGGMGSFLLYIRKTRSRKSKEKQELDDLESWGMEKFGEYQEEKQEREEVCNPTVLLSAPDKGKKLPLLHICENGEERDVILEKEIQLIGKMASSVDICLRNPSVSRIHGKVRRAGEECYLTDLNSKNGTYLNTALLEPEQEYLLQEGDIIYAAGIKMIYHTSGTDML